MVEHNHPNNKAVINRLSRISWHVDAIKHMIEDGRDCNEVLIQISVVVSALNNTGKVILKDHINHCVKDAIKNNNDTVLENLNNAIDKYFK
ncbi:metal-sensing transcriptional repressor [Clostridium thermarum]|uniref:metal-sensing transcriptional repressor n=1 Tax=Clostridium thermarum TaxID=1716543 RepID=UPI0011248F59|nr:metal-sensing transcriptional repressor [Clostridium thermarum]